MGGGAGVGVSEGRAKRAWSVVGPAMPGLILSGVVLPVPFAPRCSASHPAAVARELPLVDGGIQTPTLTYGPRSCDIAT